MKLQIQLNYTPWAELEPFFWRYFKNTPINRVWDQIYYFFRDSINEFDKSTDSNGL